MIRRGFIGACLAALGFSLNTVTLKANEPEKRVLVQGEAIKLEPYKRARSPVLRLWKLGSLEHKLYPTDAVYQKLADVLKAWDHESDLDLIWSSDIQCEQFVIGEEDVDAIPSIRILKEGES